MAAHIVCPSHRITVLIDLFQLAVEGTVRNNNQDVNPFKQQTIKISTMVNVGRSENDSGIYLKGLQMLS